MITKVLLYALVPAAAILIGGVIAAFRPPSKRTESLFQHFAAGLVFSALAGEVLPDLTQSHPNPAWVIVGFAFGVGLMLLIRWYVERRGGEEDPSGLVFVVGIDVFIDGLLIGVGVALGSVSGILVTIALALEILFLGLATGATLHGANTSRGRIIQTVAILAAPPFISVLVGGLLLNSISENWMSVVLAFATAALLFLVTEELLVEAHEVPETVFATTAFFVGFIALYIMEVIL